MLMMYGGQQISKSELQLVVVLIRTDFFNDVLTGLRRRTWAVLPNRERLIWLSQGGEGTVPCGGRRLKNSVFGWER